MREAPPDDGLAAQGDGAVRPEISAREQMQEALALFHADRWAEAAGVYRAVLAKEPHNAHAAHQLGLTHLELGALDDAARLIGEAVRQLPFDAAFQSDLGVVLLRQRRFAEAAKAFQRSLRIDAAQPQVLLNVAEALASAGQLEDARQSAKRAVQMAPGNFDAHYTLARVLMAQMRLGEAVPVLLSAVKIRPESRVCADLGKVLVGLGQLEGAKNAYKAALATDPDNGNLHLALAGVYGQLLQRTEATESYRRAAELNPANMVARASLGAALLSSGLREEATAEFEKILRDVPDASYAISPLVFISNYRDDLQPQETVKLARQAGAILARNYPARTQFTNLADPGRPLRVGFVSRDLKFGAVGFFLEGLLRALDRSRFELFAYSLSGDEDSTTQRLRQSVPNWREALTLSAADLDAQIVADRIDILVDLIGHTGSGPSPAFALKPAPVTVTWLAYSGTTGLSTMDYILADSVVIPPSEEGLFTEKVWRLPDSYLCYSPPLDTPPVAPLPALSRGCISFGSFNNLNKISDRTLALWARVLEAVPGSELVLKGIGMRQGQLEAAFAAYGIAPSRLRLLSMELATTDHLGLYREIDIGLDPFPYNGTTTTCEAMLMGVPVLAIKGDRFIAHVGESLLRTAGLPEWVAADEADYVRKAVDFAADRSRLSALRQQLRQQLFASPLCDATSFARNFEAALRGMWQRWCLEQSTPARTD